MKTCGKCGETTEDFTKNSRRCRPCANANSRQWRLDNPDKRLAQHIRYLYGMALDEYMAKFEEQGGGCAICFRPETRIDFRTDRPRRLGVDHNHDTGQVRGLLCMDCNRFLGLAGDSADRLRSAAAYLDRWNQ